MNNQKSSKQSLNIEQIDTVAKCAIQSGGYSYELVDDNVKEMKELECPICCLLMRDARELGCHHAMCLLCLEKWEKENIEKNSSFTCPQCSQEISKEKIVPSGLINRLITTSIKVKCDNSRKGCEWIGVISDIMIHMKDECNFSIIKCLNERCTLKVERNMMGVHLRECLYKIICCEYCGDFIVCAYEENHYNECGYVPVNCSNVGCSITLQRIEIMSHVEDHCDFRLMKCQFESIGCVIELPRKDMEEHIALSTNAHMTKMLVQVDTTKTELQETKAKLKVTKAQLAATMKEVDQLKLENIVGEKSQDVLLSMIEKCQFFQEMENSVVSIEENFKSVIDKKVERIRKFDSEPKLLNTAKKLKKLNKIIRFSVNSYINGFTKITSIYSRFDRSLLLQQFRAIENSGISDATEKLVVGIAMEKFEKLKERLYKCFLPDWKNITFRERFEAIMSNCSDNGMIMYENRVVLKIAYHKYGPEWFLIVKKVNSFYNMACTINQMRKEVIVELPKLFCCAGVVSQWNQYDYLRLDLFNKSKNEYFFKFRNFENAVDNHLLDGFILIELFDYGWGD